MDGAQSILYKPAFPGLQPPPPSNYPNQASGNPSRASNQPPPAWNHSNQDLNGLSRPQNNPLWPQITPIKPQIIPSRPQVSLSQKNHSCVWFLVCIQIIHVRARKWTNITFICFFSTSVKLHVFFQVACPSGYIRTNVTFIIIWSFSGVRSHMYSQTPFYMKRSWTNAAFEWGFSFVH